MHQLQVLCHPPTGEALPEIYSDATFEKVRQFHRTLPGYEPTPLVPLPALARELGVRSLYIKDESKRFGLNAFKALGASYAVQNVLAGDPSIAEIVTATDGNHGRAVAWSAARQGRRATVFMPAGSARCRIDAIRSVGDTSVFVTEHGYDDTVRMAAAYAAEHRACLVQDTGFEGYEKIPQDIVLGYSTMAAEALEQMQAAGCTGPSHVFLQAGVGSMAGGVLAYLVHRLSPAVPRFAVVEAEETACIYESVRQGRFVAIGGFPQTAMAGLNCGEPNIHTLPLLRSFAEFYIKCPDEASFAAMRRLARPLGDDPSVIAGECGAAGLGALMRLTAEGELKHWRDQMGLDDTSDILLFSTEGDTDPGHYKFVLEAEDNDQA